MHDLYSFFKTTIIGGLVVIVPLAIIAFVVGDAVVGLITIMKPLTQDFPFDALTNTVIALLFVAGVIE